MERTKLKLSTNQIKHALPNWMFSELVDAAAAVEKKPNQFRRGIQGKKVKEVQLLDSSLDEGSIGDRFPLGPNNKIKGRSKSDEYCLLLKRIASLPMEIQRCFNKWKRERIDAITDNNNGRRRWVEADMWRALDKITSRIVNTKAMRYAPISL